MTTTSKQLFKQIFSFTLAILMAIMIIPKSESLTVSAGSPTPTVWDGTIAISFDGGDGTEANPYLIATGSQLAYLAQQVNNVNSFSNGKYFRMTSDIVLNDTSNWGNWSTVAPAHEWTAIGDFTRKFYGIFDGDGHTVSGIYINKTSNLNQGLFGFSYGTIKNIGVINIYINGYQAIAGVCGYNISGTISNCYNTATVNASHGYTGGVVGYNNTGGTITGCYNTGAISGTNNSVDNTCVGGVVGRNLSVVSNCYNTGAVSSNYKTTGGVVGGNEGSITNCYNTGTVVSTSQTVGGVSGNNPDGTISNCYNTGTVSGSFQVAGISGNNLNGTISNCYNTGEVSGSSTVGAITGYNNSWSREANCYYSGFNIGIGGTSVSQTGTTAFSKILNNPLGVNKTTTITEQTSADINTAWSNGLGSDFVVAFSDTYSSSDTDVATISDTTITGKAVGNANITGRTMTITQNALTSTGFNGATSQIIVSLSLPLQVTTTGGGAVTASAPTMATDAATNVTATSATLNGTVNANNAETAVKFEYGTTTAYGTTVTADQSPVTGDSNTSVSKAISGLTENTTYHYRVVGQNAEGTTNGADMTFTTATAPTPPAPTPDPTPTPTPDPTPTPETKTLEVIETPKEIKNPELITVKPVGEAFTQSVEVRMKDDPAVKKAIEDALDSVIKEELTGTTVFPLDISLYVKGTDTKVQPKDGTSVKITCPIPKSLLTNKDKVKVVCVIDGKLTVLDTKVVEIDGVWCAEFTATHFSPYAMVVDTTNALSKVGETTTEVTVPATDTNPKTGNNNPIGTLSIIAIMSVATLTVVSKKRKFKVVK